jgi:outer membrane murein-binding lipoprotein Lpp
MRLIDVRYVRPAALALACMFVASCGDKPELVAKKEQQIAEIRKLDGELSILQDKLNQMPPDRTAELVKLKQESAANKEAISGLEAEVAALKAKKEGLEDDLKAYRSKYVIH